jgi:hypothetical protein
MSSLLRLINEFIVFFLIYAFGKLHIILTFVLQIQKFKADSGCHLCIITYITVIVNFLFYQKLHLICVFSWNY